MDRGSLMDQQDRDEALGRAYDTDDMLAAQRTLSVKRTRALACGAYHKEVTHCEVSAYLDGREWHNWSLCWNGPTPKQVHHIFGRGTREQEMRTNLIMVGAAAHSYGHDKAPNDFRMACLYAKFQKQVQIEMLAELVRIKVDIALPKEFDADVLSKIVGVPFVDWLESQGQLPEPYENYKREMIQWLRLTR